MGGFQSGDNILIFGGQHGWKSTTYEYNPQLNEEAKGNESTLTKKEDLSIQSPESFYNSQPLSIGRSGHHENEKQINYIIGEMDHGIHMFNTITQKWAVIPPEFFGFEAKREAE